MASGERNGPLNNPGGIVRIPIDETYIDPNEHVNNVGWEIYYLAACDHLADMQNIRLDGKPVTNTLLRKMHTKFRRQIMAGDDIEIETTHENRHGLVKFNQQMYRQQENVGEATAYYGELDAGLTVRTDSPRLALSLTLDDEFFLLKGQRLNHLAALLCFEAERVRLFLSRGMTIRELTERRILVVATSIDARFGKAMRVGQHVNIRTDLKPTANGLIFYQQMTEGDEVVTQARSSYVPVDASLAEPKVIPPPPELVARLMGDEKVPIPYSSELRWLK